MLHVSRKMIMLKAKEIFDDKTTDPASRDAFVASREGGEKNFWGVMDSRYGEKQKLRRMDLHV